MMYEGHMQFFVGASRLQRTNTIHKECFPPLAYANVSCWADFFFNFAFFPLISTEQNTRGRGILWSPVAMWLWCLSPRPQTYCVVIWHRWLCQSWGSAVPWERNWENNSQYNNVKVGERILFFPPPQNNGKLQLRGPDGLMSLALMFLTRNSNAMISTH